MSQLVKSLGPILTSAILAAPALAQDITTPAVDAVVITGRAENLVGRASSANEGYIGAADLARRPLSRVGEVVEAIPGVIVSQHSGGGKANQFYLRGFNLDHGTDLATSLDGMPINMVTHAHGQGYTDLNFLIPELIQDVQWRKGVYYADIGDFASAGAFDIRYFDVLPSGIASATIGSQGYVRGLIADSPQVGPGNLLYAFAYEHNDGPWQNADDFGKYNGVLKYSTGDAMNGFSITLLGYHADWDATDQAPNRAFANGLGRFDGIDDTTGGDSNRATLLAEWRRGDQYSSTRALLYGTYYDLDLFSNFTYFLDDPIRGDQFEQKDRRAQLGFKLSQTWNHDLFASAPVSGKDTGDKKAVALFEPDSFTTVGLQMRYDNIRNGLYRTQATNRLSTTRSDHTIETSVGAFLENKLQWTKWFRTAAGVRGDYFNFDVDSNLDANDGDRGKFIASPKLSLIFGPWAKTEIYLNGGLGYHSNDARGVVARVDPATGDPVSKADPLVRTKGAEIGIRTAILPGLQSSLTFWMLDVDSELLFIGDAGNTEASRPSRRYGIEWANFYEPTKWLTLDFDLAFSHTRFRDDAPEGRHIPGSVETVVAAGASLHDFYGGWFGSLRLRYFGPRSLIEDDSVRSPSTTIVNAQVGYQFNKTWSANVEIFNLFDEESSDIDYFYTSRLRGEPADGFDDIHSHPNEPRAVRFTVTAKF